MNPFDWWRVNFVLMSDRRLSKLQFAAESINDVILCGCYPVCKKCPYKTESEDGCLLLEGESDD